MKDFELSHEAVANLEEQVQKTDADEDEDRRDGDPVEQELEVPTERSEDEAAEFVQKQYKQQSGLELDSDSARDIVNTARAGGDSADSDSAPESDSDTESDPESRSETDSKD